ncbi:MAG: aldo/keto reductase [Pseudomonadota bacterium]
MQTSVPRVELAPGLSVSRPAVGMWRAHLIDSDQQLARWIEHCLDLGLTTFDHAAVYGKAQTEERFGSILVQNPSLRRQVQIITKCGIATPSLVSGIGEVYYDSSAEHIHWSVDRSLKQLRVEQIDLCLLHRPDLLMDVEETFAAMGALVAAGKVAHWGVSNFDVELTLALASRFPGLIRVNQVELSLLAPAPIVQGEVLRLQMAGIATMAWSPLAGGALTSSLVKDLDPQLLRALNEMADTYGVSDVASIALAWLLRHPACLIPVVGTFNPRNLEAIVLATGLSLSKSDWYRLAAAAGHKAI